MNKLSNELKLLNMFEFEGDTTDPEMIDKQQFDDGTDLEKSETEPLEYIYKCIMGLSKLFIYNVCMSYCWDIHT